MNIIFSTFLITFTMAICFVAPRLSQQIEARSKIFLLIGTGGLVSLFFADLLPDIVQLGGPKTLGIVLAVWFVYSYFHIFHLKQHEACDSHDDHHGSHIHLPESSGLLMASMISHSFSSGMLLFLSASLSAKIAASVFLAMIGHKGYESLAVSVLLSQRIKQKKKFVLSGVAFAASFPLGVLTTAFFTHALGSSLSPALMQTVAILVASVAVGSLAACVLHDFVLPSWNHLKTRKHEATWLLVGIGLTCLFTLGLPG